jgi:HPt (histidine-containing phosphotransfer) domain-containing protein
MPQLHVALAGSDHAAVRHVAHTLKSSSASIGAIKLSRLCAEIETMVRLQSLEGLAERAAEMDRETAVVLQALKRITGVPT